jgi:hypothetical protein
MNHDKEKTEEEYSDEDIRAYMALPAREKLRMLEEWRSFYQRLATEESKKIWERLKDEGV